MKELDYYFQPEAVDAMLESVAKKENGVVLLPTGSGKSHVIQGFVKKFTGGILVVSHVKEILEQNLNRLAGIPDVGLYSASLGVKVVSRVTVSSIQSIFRNPHLFADVEVVLIDEAHLVSDEGMYKKLLSDLGVPYIGLTATDFRLKGGYIHGPDGMFDKVIYKAPAKRLTKEGYLCPLVYYGDKEPLNTEGIRTTAGDFNLADLSMRFNREAVTGKLAEQIARYEEYKHILIFCIDIEHAENVAEALNKLGMRTVAVHSKSPRDEAIRAFQAGEFQALTNVNILTTGFDYPEIDMVVLLRPTKSLTLHQQMLGRGMRIHPSKTETLVKDFTGNTQYLGTVTDPRPMVEKKKGKGKGDAWMKSCPECDILWYAATLACTCGHKFKFQHNLKLNAHKDIQLPKWYSVDEVYYNIHHKPGKPNSMKVTYMCGLKMFTQYILLDHGGFAGQSAKRWVQKRFKGNPLPTTIPELHGQRHLLKPPLRVQVDEGSKYARILSVV